MCQLNNQFPAENKSTSYQIQNKFYILLVFFMPLYPSTCSNLPCVYLMHKISHKKCDNCPSGIWLHDQSTCSLIYNNCIYFWNFGAYPYFLIHSISFQYPTAFNSNKNMLQIQNEVTAKKESENYQIFNQLHLILVFLCLWFLLYIPTYLVGFNCIKLSNK